MRDWLVAVHQRDAAACDLMTAEYRQTLAPARTGGVAGDCQKVVESATSDALAGLPPGDSEMDVPAWDPSGEALVEVTDGDQVRGFWMLYEDGRWLVAGTAP